MTKSSGKKVRTKEYVLSVLDSVHAQLNDVFGQIKTIHRVVEGLTPANDTKSYKDTIEQPDPIYKDMTGVPIGLVAYARKVADLIGVTPYSDMRPFVVQAVRVAIEGHEALPPLEGTPINLEEGCVIMRNKLTPSMRAGALKALREIGDRLTVSIDGNEIVDVCWEAFISKHDVEFEATGEDDASSDDAPNFDEDDHD